ncbi:MAG: TusE/DsrC/DsvC family sulfur relay protein [Sulfuricaulis sp.]
MVSLLDGIKEAGNEPKIDPKAPYAPEDWSEKIALKVSQQEGLKLTEEHWEVLRALQEYFAKHEQSVPINVRELRDALDEKFHRLGGMRYLYELFPGGPVAQGCRLAGLRPPAGIIDKGFGSVI